MLLWKLLMSSIARETLERAVQLLTNKLEGYRLSKNIIPPKGVTTHLRTHREILPQTRHIPRSNYGEKSKGIKATVIFRFITNVRSFGITGASFYALQALGPPVEYFRGERVA
uniref:Uncharacterized protein n=1 Tax=Glossina pallidipes TaxID=7398 RepID=A0A1A9ZGI9_GLOPL